MSETEIYVELEEGSATPVFAAVAAIHLGQKFYRILEHNRRDYDALRFNVGTYVFCLTAEIKGNLMPVAYSEISQEAVEYILSNSQK